MGVQAPQRGISGRLLNKDHGGFDRPMGLFSSMPLVDHLCDYNVFFDDFHRCLSTAGTLTGTLSATGTIVDVAAAACAGGATPTATQVDTAIDTLENSTNLALKELASRMNQFLIIKDTGASALISADAENGALVLSSTATTDDDGAAIQADNCSFLVKSGKKLWFEARVKVSDADQCDMFVGLCENFATNPENAIAEGCARVGFELVDGSAVIKCVTDNNTASTKTSSGVSASDATYVRLGFRTDGSSIRFYVNRSLVLTADIPSAIAAITLGPAFFGLSGNNTGTHTRTIDYIMAVQERV